MKIAKQAKKQAEKAKRSAAQAKQLARGARSAADVAQSTADGAGAAATAAGAQAAEAQKQLDGRRAVSATAAATVNTSNDAEYVDLAGPRVRVTVPESGLIEVWAQATADPEGAVSLFEDGQQMPGQDPDRSLTVAPRP